MDPQELETLNKLRSVFTLEQLQLVAESVVFARKQAMERRCNQSVEVLFNDKGYPRYITAGGTSAFPVPANKYSPE